MRLRARLTSLTAIAAAIALFAPMAPAAAAAPNVVGEYVTFTPTVTRTVVPDECRDVVAFNYLVDLETMGNEIQAQGYVYEYDKGRPVYNQLSWKWSYRVTGPDNFYADASNYRTSFPDNQESPVLEVCPSDFGADAVSAGTYSIEATVSVTASNLCKGTEPCVSYPDLYQRTVVAPFTLVGETPPPPSAECLAAQAQVKTFSAKVAQAKVALKKAKRTTKPAKIRKAKKRLRTFKGKLATARGAVDQHC